MEYLQFIRGCDLGCFVAKYEPFGYASPECMCVGTPSLVSDLAGFGRFMNNLMRESTSEAVENVVTRS